MQIIFCFLICNYNISIMNRQISVFLCEKM